MITSFEQHTAPLTATEVLLMHQVAALLKNEARKDAEINNRQISERFAPLKGAIGSARIRKIINQIRITGLVPRLLANSKGYYISNDAGEIDDYIASLHQRAGAILAVEKAIQSQKLTPVHSGQNGQTELFEEDTCLQRSTILKGANTQRL